MTDFGQFEFVFFPRHLYEVVSLLVLRVDAFESLAQSVEWVVSQLAQIHFLQLAELRISHCHLVGFRFFLFLLLMLLML